MDFAQFFTTQGETFFKNKVCTYVCASVCLTDSYYLKLYFLNLYCNYFTIIGCPSVLRSVFNKPKITKKIELQVKTNFKTDLYNSLFLD